MDYNHIKNYLEKFRSIIFSKEENYLIILNIINKNTGIELNKKSVETRGTVVYIKASPLVKSEILINKERILSDLSQSLPQSNLRDIR